MFFTTVGFTKTIVAFYIFIKATIILVMPMHMLFAFINVNENEGSCDQAYDVDQVNPSPKPHATILFNRASEIEGS